MEYPEQITVNKREYEELKILAIKLLHARAILESIAESVPREKITDPSAFSAHGHAQAVGQALGWVLAFEMDKQPFVRAQPEAPQGGGA